MLWFTGLSGAGKSTLAVELERRLFAKGYQIFLLDGDNVRQGLNADLGFSPQERAENIRRVGEVAALFAEAGMIVISAFISPYRVDRDRVRAAHARRTSTRSTSTPPLHGARRATQGPVPQGARRRGQGLHRHLGALRGADRAELEMASGEWTTERCIAALIDYVEEHLAYRPAKIRAVKCGVALLRLQRRCRRPVRAAAAAPAEAVR